MEIRCAFQNPRPIEVFALCGSYGRILSIVGYFGGPLRCAFFQKIYAKSIAAIYNIVCADVVLMENAFDMFPTRLNACEQALANLQTQIENAKAEVEKPFAQEDELRTKMARLAELDAMLNMDKRENDTLDATPEQEEERTKRRSEPEYER